MSITEIKNVPLTKEEYSRAVQRIGQDGMDNLLWFLHGWNGVLTNGTILTPEQRLKKEHYVECIEEMLKTNGQIFIQIEELVEVLGEPTKIVDSKKYRFKEELND